MGVLSEASPLSSSGDIRDQGSLIHLAKFTLRHWRLVLGMALLAGTATAASYLLLFPRVYEASAMLVIVVPKVAPELKPTSLTIQGYQKLLESDAILQETHRLLAAKGSMKADETLRVGTDLETRIFVSKYSETIALTPMIQLLARSKTPARAADLANTWATVLQARVRELMSGTTSVTIQFVEDQYPKSKERRSKLETDLMEVKKTYHQRIDEETTALDQRIAQFKNETLKLVAAEEIEGIRRAGELKAGLKVVARRQKLQAFRNMLAGLQEEHARSKAILDQKKEEVEALRQGLAQTNAFLTLRKALTDESFWKTIVEGRGKEPDWKLLQDRSLLTQEVNPVHRELSLQLSHLEVETRTLTLRAAQLGELLPRMEEQLKEEDVALTNDEGKVDKLERENSVAVASLKETRTAKLANLERDRLRTLETLGLERDARLAPLEREILQEKELFGDLMKQYNQSLLVKAQQNVEEVRTASPAVPVERAQSKGTAIAVLIAMFLGSCVGFTIALVRSVRTRV